MTSIIWNLITGAALGGSPAIACEIELKIKIYIAYNINSKSFELEEEIIKVLRKEF